MVIKKKQEDVESMRMIYQELSEGVEQLKTIQKYYQYEGEMATLIQNNYKSDFKDMQEDSVSLYYT